MTNLAEILNRVGDVAEFADIEVTDPNTQALFQDRPLHIAAVWGDCEAINALVEAGAEVDASGEHGFTPLMEAAAQGHVEACKLLIALGATAVANHDGQIPSECAAASGKNLLSSWLAAHRF